MNQLVVNYIQVYPTRKLPEMNETSAYWVIFQNGELKILDITGSTHIRYLIQNPETFGITRHDIEKLYAEYGEKIGQEGHARELLIIQVAQDGWMRVRHYIGRNDYWSLQVDDTTKRRKLIRTFVYHMINKRQMHPGDSGEVVGYNTAGDHKSYSFQDGGISKLLTEGGPKMGEQLQENKMTRLRAMLSGYDFQNLYSMGIITAENPLGKKLSASENQLRNKELEKVLRSANYSYLKVNGSYGALEHSFVIQNVKREFIKNLAIEFKQKAYIYGESYEKDNRRGVLFKYFEQEAETKVGRSRAGEVHEFQRGNGIFSMTSERNTYVEMTDAKDYFTVFRGFKFQIPFFDSLYDLQHKESTRFSTWHLNEETLNNLKARSWKAFKEQLLSKKSEKAKWENRGHINLILAGELIYEQEKPQVTRPAFPPLREFVEIPFE